MNSNPEIPDLCRQGDAWLDGQLPESAAAQFEAHLFQCPYCRSRIESAQEFELEIEAACRLFANSISDTVANSELQESQKLPRPVRSFYNRQAFWAATATIAAGILVILWLAWPPTPAPSGNPVQVTQSNPESQNTTELAKPTVQIAFTGSALAEPAITTERFTFVRVFAVTTVTPKSTASDVSDFQ